MRPRPYPWDRPKVPVAFLDPASGDFLGEDGTTGKVKARKATVVEKVLYAAEATAARRVFLIGAKPTDPAWLDARPLDGYQPAGHFYELRDPCGRWSDRDGRVTEVRRIASWFGEGDYSLATARDALALTHAVVNRASRGFAGVMGSPAATGQSWFASTLRAGQLDEQTSDDVATLIRSTSPQHREEVFGRCFGGCDEHADMVPEELPGLHYLDGVFMYATCCRELGGRAILLDSERLATAYFEAHEYGRARYRLRFTVPGNWFGPGLLPVKHPNGRNWHYPSRPGLSAETWADAGEVWQAVSAGWSVKLLGMIRFQEGHRPLDTFADAVVRERAKLVANADPVSVLAARAIRALFIRTLGSFASTGRQRSYVVPAGVELPAGVEEWTERANGDRIYSRKHELFGNAAAFMRPELSSQVWARARVKVAKAMLTVPGDQLVAVWGDALYLTTDPGWRGTEVGTFRPKARLTEPSARPNTIGELLRLRVKMTEV